MSLSQKIAAALDASPNASAPPSELAVEDGPYRLSFHLTAAGAVGIAFDVLDFSTSARPEWSAEALQAWGGRIAARVTYLMEPLVVLEVDAVGGEVELRSQEPTARRGNRSYYEVRLNRNGALRLRRLSFDESTRRHQPVPCQLTREVLERLADDLTASVA